ncbi:mediator of RNA polymerase II transcription subunit 28 [Nasonia vitripennis]|uniref:Mediator of RNA polymerase II transcription subunit 28 n=1 Tax=Nasonia vitripennis TaxID=7425 RepID=A0A7M7GLL8_NASVI|nr:mediator of RNA polymerase II transcription subunit 28 [Nasonia vitripennis]
MATPTNGNGNLIDEFEESFQQCLNLFIKEDGLEKNGVSSLVDKDETKLEVDQTTLRFIDLARQVEAFFLQKRFLLSALKPELVIKEEVQDLRNELVRKEDLMKKHYEKIQIWQKLLAEMHGGVQRNGLANSNQAVQPQVTTNGSNNPVQQQLLQQQRMQQQHQHQTFLLQQRQQLQQQAQQGPSGAGNSPNIQGAGVPVGPQNVMMNQPNTARPAGFPVGVNNSPLQGPLAFLEKTTSNIGMPERRS